MRKTRYVVYGNIVWHIIKIGVPCSTLATCFRFDVNDTAECDIVTEHRITLMLYCDCIFASLLIIWCAYAMTLLISKSWKYSRLESRQHMFYWVCNCIGLLLAFPLVFNGLVAFIKNYE